MKKVTLKQAGLLTALSVSVFLTACGEQGGKTATASNDDSPIIIVVNGVEIPESRIAAYTQGAPIPDNERQRVLENIAISELISQVAEQKGYAADATQDLIVAKQATLGRIYATKFLDDNQLTDAQVQARFDELSQNFPDKEFDVAHILVEDEALANELQEKINADASQFGALAAEHSTDTISAQNEGKLGWFANNGTLVPEFSEAMASLGAGETTKQPVQSQFGWHIIHVADVRAAEPPVLTDEIAAEIRQREQSLMFADHLDALRQEATIEFK